jgi:hypothetical protein
MKVTINQRQMSTGFILKTTVYLVDCIIEFSEEELQQIHAKKLLNHVLYVDMEDPYGNLLQHEKLYSEVTVRKKIKGLCKTRHLKTAGDAYQWEQTLRNNILPGLKKLIDSGTTSDTFEL